MAGEKENTKDNRESSGLLDAARTVLMASIGAFSLATDEIVGFVDRLVERGEIAEQDARELVKDIISKRESLEKERKSSQSRRKEPQVTKADIEALSTKINALNKKLEELQKQQ